MKLPKLEREDWTRAQWASAETALKFVGDELAREGWRPFAKILWHYAKHCGRRSRGYGVTADEK